MSLLDSLLFTLQSTLIQENGTSQSYILSFFLYRDSKKCQIKESWNHSGWKRLLRSSTFNLVLKSATKHSTSLHFLQTSRDGESTTFLGNLLQCHTTLSVKTFLLMSSLNFLWHNLRLFPFILSLVAWENRRSLLQHPLRQL